MLMLRFFWGAGEKNSIQLFRADFSNLLAFQFNRTKMFRLGENTAFFKNIFFHNLCFDSFYTGHLFKNTYYFLPDCSGIIQYKFKEKSHDSQHDGIRRRAD